MSDIQPAMPGQAVILYQGEFLNTGNDSLRCNITPVKVGLDEWHFKIQLTNLTRDSLLVSPERIFYRYELMPGDVGANLIAAIHPHDRSNILINKQEKLRKRKQNFEGREALMDLVDLGVSILPNHQPPTDQEKAEKAEREEWVESHKKGMEKNQEKLRIQNEAEQQILLKEMELAPLQFVEGLVIFPSNELYGNIQVVIDLHPYTIIKEMNTISW